MPSPFPGMDPYLERPSLWPDVHNKLISELQSELNPRLPAKYVARMEARVYVMEEGDSGRAILVPDLRIEKSTTAADRRSAKAVATIEVAEPLEYLLAFEEEISESYLTIQDRDREALVAVIEVLSHPNKMAGSAGRTSFLNKKREVLASDVHWIEIDLLRKGERLPASPPLVASDFRVTVSRGNARKMARYWPIQVRQKLPAIGIPLRGKDAEIAVDLGVVLNTAYDRAAYQRSINYSLPPDPPLSPTDTKWANALLRAKGIR